MASQSMLARIADKPKLSTPSAVTMSVMECSSHSDCTIQEISEIISDDSELSGIIMKLANSRFFGENGAVTSINHALNLLGFNRRSLDALRDREEKGRVERGLAKVTEASQRTDQHRHDLQKMEAIGRLAGGIAHDFNNLLTVILGNCELVLDNRSIDRDARAMIETILQTGQAAADLTRQLLAVSRTQKSVPKVVNLNGTIIGMSNVLSRLAGTDVQLITRLSDRLDLVQIDPTQLEQVLLNLVVNARAAMPNGGQLTVETFNHHVEADTDVAVKSSAMHVGHYVVIAVHDTGCGMDEETMRQIFEPFFTTKEKGRGAGLGLATVHGIVAQSGGHITVRSSPGQGTVFHIYLPTYRQSPLPPHAAARIPMPGQRNATFARSSP